MDENTLYAIAWRCIVAIIVGIAVTVGSCTAHTHYQITAAIDAGASPMEASCAHEEMSTMCTVLAAKK